MSRFACVLLIVALLLLTLFTSTTHALHVKSPLKAVQNILFSPAEAILRLNVDGKPITVDYQKNPPAHRVRGAADVCYDEPSLPMGLIQVVSLTLSNGEVRSFEVYVPKSYKGRKTTPAAAGGGDSYYTPVAVQVLIHGLGDSCENFMNATGFLEYAEENSYVLVSACGTMGSLGRAWNAGTCCGFYDHTPDGKPNEVLFLTTLVQALTDEFDLCIHEEKIFATGFSNGAMMAEVLGCNAPHIFRAVASVGGVVEVYPGNEDGLSNCDLLVKEADANHSGHHRTSVLMVHGDWDYKVPWGGNSFLGFPSMTDNVARWAQRNGCAADPITTIDNNIYRNERYEDCHAAGNATTTTAATAVDAKKWTDQSTIEVVRVLGGSHSWPERDNFSTTQYIVDFARDVFGNFNI